MGKSVEARSAIDEMEIPDLATGFSRLSRPLGLHRVGIGDFEFDDE
jgi:hypothetical protein